MVVDRLVRCPRRLLPLTLVAMSLAAMPAPARAQGARLFKTGPIQVTRDGRFVWTANRDNGSISRLDILSEEVTEVPLAECAPAGVSVREDGDQVWVTCPDADAVLVLDGEGEAEVARIALPFGSGPAFVALAPDQSRAVVTLNRGDGVAVLDAESLRLLAILPTRRAPLGAAWSRDGRSAWITHASSDGQRTFVTRLDLAGGMPRIGDCAPIGMQEPQVSSSTLGLLADGGAVTLRGHLAQIPAASGREDFWIPSQHSGINDPVLTMDTSIKAAVHRLDPGSASVDPAARLVLSAVQAHDPTGRGTWDRAGWDARVSGLVDVGFSADGSTAYLLGESSDDVLVVPTSIDPWRDGARSPLKEISVGRQPTGMAVSPIHDVAYVLDSLDNEVSIVGLRTEMDLARVPVTPLTGDRLAPTVRLGRQVFTTSDRPEVSGNQKVACASCHSNGENDGLVWRFDHLTTAIGPRSTTSLLGLSRTFGRRDPATGLGQLHRSGDRDEIQDFEHTFRDQLMNGTGFFSAPPNPYQGPSNSGRAAEVDAMAAYLLSLSAPPRSPHRDAHGRLSPSAVRGATMFRGAGGMPADAACATCHVPEIGYIDGRFHDVGSAHPTEEVELESRAPAWHVNTPTLIGLWATAPFDDAGAAGDQRQDLVDVLADFARRDGTPTPHGNLGELTLRQLHDLAAFVLSIDGRTQVDEVMLAADGQAPGLMRAEAVSPTRIACWFDETVDPASASSPSNWRVVADDGREIDVLEARWDASWGDRVTLTTEPLLRDCVGRSFTVLPGPILDAAGWTTGGSANVLDAGDPANARSFVLGDSITVTLGASGQEHVAVEVHDAAMAGPDAPDRSEAEPWIRRIAGPASTRGFVRFAWQGAFAEATGVTAADDIVEASFSLQPEWGGSQAVHSRRVLQAWSDPHAGDGDTTGPGAPTWAEHGRGLGPWNVPGALALGSAGDDPADYFAGFDLAEMVDASGVVSDLTRSVTFGGPRVTAAYRLWFARPALDMGHALEISDGPGTELRFHRSESALGAHAPRLAITYRLPPAPRPAPEVSPRGSDRPLLVTRVGLDLLLSFADDWAGREHEVFEGAIGGWYSHAGMGCVTPAPGPPGRLLVGHAPATGDRYLIVGASDPCGGDLGSSTTGAPRPLELSACAP